MRDGGCAGGGGGGGCGGGGGGGGVCYMRACVGRGSAGGGVPVWQYSVTSSSGGVGPGGCQDTDDVLIFILVLDSLLQTLTSGSHVEFRTIDDDRGCVDFVKSTRAMHIA